MYAAKRNNLYALNTIKVQCVDIENNRNLGYKNNTQLYDLFE